MSEPHEEQNTLEKLRESEEDLRHTQQLARLGSWSYEAVTDRYQWSDEMYAIFGMRPSDGPPSPKLIGSCIHPEDVAVFEAHVASVKPHCTDYRITLPDGAVRHIHEEVRVERDTAGNPVRMHGTAQDITEQQRSVEALRESEGRYRAIVESQAEFVVRYQQGGILTFVNDTLCRYGGMRREDLLGRSYYPFMHPDDRDAFIRKIEALDRKNPSMIAEARVVLPDGRVKWHRWTHHAIFDDQGRIVEYQSTGRDVTELNRAQEELAERDATLQQIMDTASVAIFLVNKNGRITHANKRMAEMFGRHLPELIGCEYVDLVHPSKRETGRQKMLALLASDISSIDLERLYWRKDGTQFLGHLTGRRFHDVNGAELGLIGVIADISARKQAEEKQRESENRFRALFENINLVALVIDPEDGRILDANEAAAAYYGWSREQLRKMLISQINTLPTDEIQTRMNEVKLRKLSSFLLKHRRGDGSVRDVEVHSGPIPFEGRTALYSVVHDVTERMQTEDALKESEEKFSLIFSKAPLLITLSEVETGRLLDVNDKFLEISGYAREEVVGRTVVDLGWISEEQRARLRQTIGERGRVTGMELSLRRKDGRTVICLYNGEIISVGGNQRLLSIAQDITERQKSENEVELFRTLLNRSNDAIFVNDLQSGRFLDMNDRACSGLGYSREELLQMGVKDIEATFPDDRVWQDHVAEVKRRGALLLEGMHKRKDGTTFPAEINVSYVDLGAAEYMIAVVRDISERKQADAALRDRERRLAESQRIAHIGSWEHNLKNGQVFWSDELFRMLGLDPRKDPADFNLFFKMVHPDDQPLLKNAIDMTLKEQKPFSTVYRLVLQDKTTRIIEAQAELIPDEAGELVILSGTAQDVTERKQAELERERLAKAVSIVTEGIAVTDEQDRYIYVNDAHAKYYGYAPHELLGKTWRDVTPREFVSMIESALARTLHNKDIGVWSGEAPGLRTDGTRITTEITATARWSEKDEYAGHICVVRDITERKRIDEALRVSEARFRSIIENAASGIIVADAGSGTILYANPEICRMLGYSDKELPELDISLVHPAEELTRVRKSFAAAQGIQTVCLRKDGTTVPVEIKAVEIELDGRRCIAGFFTDITERRLLEEERLKTQKLESVGTLAGGIAHDFNNLLQAVFGYISMAKLTLNQREKALAMLEQAEKALHRSVSLTSQLLTFSKGGKPMKKALALPPIIENAVKFALSGSRSGHTMTIAPDLRPVEADEGQIGQVFQNIVLNADQAMPLGGMITIEARNSAGREGFVEISVRDTGVGIPAEYLTKIFDPYFTTKEKGSGLGLATSYSIIKNHGGEVAVTSEQGRGSTFTVLLPASKREPQPPPPSGTPAPLRRGRVLVMDDEEAVRGVAAELLRTLDQDVEVAAHGGEALEKYQEARSAGRPFDVVILDITVRGGMGGAEAMRKLREIEPGVKAIVSSGYSADSLISDYESCGFRACLVKPYELEKLRSVLNGLLG
jgi:two-component system cell cycle sensor histidine kinase/response regulator CckA